MRSIAARTRSVQRDRLAPHLDVADARQRQQAVDQRAHVLRAALDLIHVDDRLARTRAVRDARAASARGHGSGAAARAGRARPNRRTPRARDWRSPAPRCARRRAVPDPGSSRRTSVSIAARRSISSCSSCWRRRVLVGHRDLRRDRARDRQILFRERRQADAIQHAQIAIGMRDRGDRHAEHRHEIARLRIARPRGPLRRTTSGTAPHRPPPAYAADRDTSASRAAGRALRWSRPLAVQRAALPPPFTITSCAHCASRMSRDGMARGAHDRVRIASGRTGAG